MIASDGEGHPFPNRRIVASHCRRVDRGWQASKSTALPGNRRWPACRSRCRLLVNIVH
jgi:hypothetical protein